MTYYTETTELNGRLGNQIIRNIATSFIAEKNNLFVKYSSHDRINKLGIPLFIGENQYDEMIIVNDENFFDILNMQNLNSNIYTNSSYFQTKEISNFIYKYLHSDNVKTSIMNSNIHKARYNNNKDCFVHIRLDDAIKYNPGIKYYLKAINNIIDRVDNIIISTDSPNHDMILKIIDIFHDKAKILITDEVETIQFGSTCKYLILSHGSFSANIGWLGFFSEIYYPEYDEKNIWFGDMFSIDSWKKIEYLYIHEIKKI